MTNIRVPGVVLDDVGELLISSAGGVLLGRVIRLSGVDRALRP